LKYDLANEQNPILGGNSKTNLYQLDDEVTELKMADEFENQDLIREDNEKNQLSKNKATFDSKNFHAQWFIINGNITSSEFKKLCSVFFLSSLI
jgi:hypothetical protein